MVKANLSPAAHNAMLTRDPDGGNVEPTESMYEDFRSWAISKFGRKAYDAYMSNDNYLAEDDGF